MIDVDKLWSIRDVAAYLDVPVQTLYQWRSRGYGPRGVRLGRHVRFRPEDVRSWVADQIRIGA